MAEPTAAPVTAPTKTFREKYGAPHVNPQDVDNTDYEVKPGGWQIIKPETFASQQYQPSTVLKPLSAAKKPPAIKLTELEESSYDAVESPPVTPAPRTPALNSASAYVPDSPSSVTSGVSSMMSLPPPPPKASDRPLILVKGKATNRAATRNLFEAELGFLLRKVQGYVSMGMVVAKKNWLGAQKVYVAAEFETEATATTARNMLTGQVVAGYKLIITPYSNMDDDDKE